MNELPIEVGKAKEGLDVFNLLRFWKLLDITDFLVSHCQAEVHQDISEELNGISLPCIFVCFGIETMFPEASEQFTNVFLVLIEIVRIDEDVIEIDHNALV